MVDMERLQHEMYAKLPAFERKVDRAHEIIREAFAVDGHPFYLAWSSGADSTVLLHMLSHYPWQVPTFWGDDGLDFSESLTFLSETEARYGFHLHRIRCMQPWRDWCVEMDRSDLCSDPEALETWGNPRVWDDTWESLKDSHQHGYGGVFLGLLAKESRGRNYQLQGGLRPLYQVKAEQGMWHCSPLANWTKREVWAYLVSRNVPYNPIYDRLAELGVPLEYRRVAPLTCYRVLQFGSAIQFRQIDPALYNKMTTLFPRMREFS